MQDRYTGDIGDYGKLGLLRAIAAGGLTVGVNWYLTPDESHNCDGRHTDYLRSEDYRSCDEKLWLELKQIVDTKNRFVRALQKKQILDGTFFPDKLDFKGKSKEERKLIRDDWHDRALKKLNGLDVVFVDPDNGLLVKSADGKPKENKFVRPEELEGYVKQGSSVIYYQHKARVKDEFYLDRHALLLERDAFRNCSGLCLKFKTTSQRFYFFIIQPRHRAVIERIVDGMLETDWQCHFEKK